MFKKATKSNLKIRLALSGASGSGKTFSSLSIASHIASKIALIDTERGSASKYADIFSFDACELDNYHPAKYIEAIQNAETMGYEIIIIDSLSHAWFSELELAGGRFDGWSKVRPLERKLIDAIIGSKCHIIATMRSKTEWLVEETQKNGKASYNPKKVGTAPIQSNGIEYEFDIAGEIDYNHILTISKSRCPQLSDRTFLNPSKELANLLLKWIEVPQPNQEPWKSWKTPENAITWASEQLPDWDIDAIQEEFNELKTNNGKKAPAWVEKVNVLKNQNF
jgi:AAA domain